MLELSLSALLVTAGAALLRQLLCASVEHRRLRGRKRTGGRNEAEVLQNVLEYVDSHFCSAEACNGEDFRRCDAQLLLAALA